MKMYELDKKLKELGIPEERYYLHGLYGSSNDNGVLSLTIIQIDGKLKFEVYHKERGEKQTLREFEMEDDACEYIYSKLIENKRIEDMYSH